MRLLLAHWAFAFAFTQLVEIPIYVRALRVRPLIAFGASALTHPIVAFVMPAAFLALDRALIRHGLRSLVYDPAYRFWGFAVLAEGFAVLAEAAYFRAFKAPRPLLWSFIANGASAGIGYVCSRVTGWP